MKAYNKKRKPKHHIKPKWKIKGGYSCHQTCSYQIGMNMKQPKWVDKFLGLRADKIRYRVCY